MDDACSVLLLVWTRIGCVCDVHPLVRDDIKQWVGLVPVCKYQLVLWRICQMAGGHRALVLLASVCRPAEGLLGVGNGAAPLDLNSAMNCATPSMSRSCATLSRRISFTMAGSSKSMCFTLKIFAAHCSPVRMCWQWAILTHCAARHPTPHTHTFGSHRQADR